MQLKSLVDSVIKKVTDTAQTILNKDEHSEKHSINELVVTIKTDESTTKTTRTLLGIDFHQYDLKKDTFHFTLETKGSTEKVLSLTIMNHGTPIFKYRSYDSKLSLDKNLNIPIQLPH